MALSPQQIEQILAGMTRAEEGMTSYEENLRRIRDIAMSGNPNDPVTMAARQKLIDAQMGARDLGGAVVQPAAGAYTGGRTPPTGGEGGWAGLRDFFGGIRNVLPNFNWPIPHGGPWKEDVLGTQRARDLGGAPTPKAPPRGRIPPRLDYPPTGIAAEVPVPEPRKRRGQVGSEGVDPNTPDFRGIATPAQEEEVKKGVEAITKVMDESESFDDFVDKMDKNKSWFYDNAPWIKGAAAMIKAGAQGYGIVPGAAFGAEAAADEVIAQESREYTKRLTRARTLESEADAAYKKRLADRADYAIGYSKVGNKLYAIMSGGTAKDLGIEATASPEDLWELANKQAVDIFKATQGDPLLNPEAAEMTQEESQAIIDQIAQEKYEELVRLTQKVSKYDAQGNPL